MRTEGREPPPRPTLEAYARDTGLKWAAFVAAQYPILRSEADDVVSTVLLEAYQAGWDTIVMPDQWVRCRLKQRALDRIRQLRRVDLVPLPEPHEETLAWADAAAEGDPAQQVAGAEDERLLRELLRHLPLEQRENVYLELAGFSAKERGQALGWSETNARVALHRSRNALQKLLNERADYRVQVPGVKESTA
ncbi:RNA polymerase sigma factor [Streptomyces sp. NPDC053474]|uniref:RNA polymerase sigma factor n=1 Tax=Streptomyces sp. NPDC053474 TaxID=3365704 RepID=UPI0037D59C32